MTEPKGIPTKELSIPSTAVFIDGDWIRVAARHLRIDVDFLTLADLLRSYFGKDTETHFFGSVLPGDEKAGGLFDKLKSNGVKVEVFDLVDNADGRLISKGLDVAMSLRAATLPTYFDRVAILSGDNDFVPLFDLLQGKGISTVLISLPIVSGKLLHSSATHFISLEDFLGRAKSHSAENIPPRPANQPFGDMYVEKDEHFEPYLQLRELFLESNYQIVVIDQYIDWQIFEMIRLTKKEVKICILTNRIQEPDYQVMVEKLRREGRILCLYRTRDFHDRYLRVDDQWWHSGHSFKDLGTADSRLSIVTDKEFTEKLEARQADSIRTAIQLCT
ncbi:MAG: NYN domain-containing protein [Paracoccaceae bacterium]|nr:NYN domain-containing protein [Paracoccaceae bacterium]